MIFKITSQTGSFVLRFLFITTLTFIIFIHLLLSIQAVKDGLPINESNFSAKGILLYRVLWSNKPAIIQEMGGINREKKFMLPEIEQYDFPREYKKIITYDFKNHPPIFLIFNKNTYKQLDPNNFYTRVIMKSLEKYQLIFENDQIRAYKRI